MIERDFDADPYSPDEQRVADYLRKIMPEIGAGDDPIGFLIASHAMLRCDAGCIVRNERKYPRFFRGWW